MDRLIDLQDSRLLALEQEFEMELSTLQKVLVCVIILSLINPFQSVLCSVTAPDTYDVRGSLVIFVLASS